MERGYSMTAKTNKHYNITDLKDSITDLENQYAEHYMHDEKGMEMAIQSAINCCKKFIKDNTSTTDKLNTYKITRTQTIIDYQTVVSTSEDSAYSCLEDDGWEDEIVDSSDSSIELINGGN